MRLPVKQYPFYFKSTVVLFGLVLLSISLYTLRDILSPIAFSLIMAILLNPLVNKMQKKGIHKVAAIIIALTLAILVVSGILFFITTQFISFGDNLPAFKESFNQHFSQLQHWLATEMNVTIARQQKMISDALSSSQAIVGKTLGTALSTIGFFVLVPIYIFLLLYYKNLILNFLHEVFAEENSDKVSEVLGETKAAIQSYMVGLLLEALVVAAMNVTALLLLGVQYAVLLGVIGALLNFLPYIGGLVAIILPVLISVVTKDGLTIPILIIAAYSLIQFIDNHFLVPLLVSSRVKINAFFSIVIVLLGGALWGMSGMFLSIPFLAILKIIFDRLPEMKPWGRLLGDEVPTRIKRKRIKKQVANNLANADAAAEKTNL